MKPGLTKISSENDVFQSIQALQRNRTKRHQTRQFFVEGVRAITQAVHYHWRVTMLIYSREQRLSDWASWMIETASAQRLIELPLSLLHKLSQKDEPSELLAVVEMPPDYMDRIPVRDPALVLVLDRMANPGNIGTIIRSCDGLGADGVVLSGHSADLYDPETIRATTGSFFATPTISLPSHRELIPWIERRKAYPGGLVVVGTSAKAKTPLYEYDFTRPTLLLVGSENHGLSKAYQELAEEMITIPMAAGSASSLNAATAASILLYEISRQRGNQPRTSSSRNVH